MTETGIKSMNEIRRPGGLVQRCLVIHRDENGFGLTVSGDNPVYVQSVKENSAAARTGVQVGDQIIKVNGTDVTQSNHIEVVRLIKSGSFVALTLLGKDSSPRSPDGRSSPRPNSGHTRSRSVGNSLAFNTTLPQQPTPSENKQNGRLYEIERSLQQERDFYKKILGEYSRAPSQRSQQELADSQTRINALENQYKTLTGSTPQKSPGFNSRPAFRPVNENLPPWSSPQQRVLSTGYNSGQPISGLPIYVNKYNLNTDQQNEPRNMKPKKMSTSTSPRMDEHTTDSKRSKLDSVDAGETSKYSVGDNSFDSLFLQAQQDNLSPSPALHSAASVISMEDDEFEFENERFDNHGPFIDLKELNERPAHLAVFLHFLMSNSNPSPLFFWLVTDTYAQETGNVKDLKKWAYEIYSTFLGENAPLKVDIGKPEELAIEDALESPKTSEDRIRSVFNVSRDIIFSEVNEQLADFRNKRALGLGGLFGDHQLEDELDKGKELKVIEQTLLPHLEALMADAGSPNEIQNNRNSAMASALATFMKQVGLSGKLSTGRNHILDRCRSFAEKEKKSFMSNLKTNRGVYRALNHSFVNMQYTSITLCGHCKGLLWGIGTQGYQCTVCEFNVHKRSCFESLTEICPGSKKKPKVAVRPLGHSLPKPEVTFKPDLDDSTNNAGSKDSPRNRGISIADVGDSKIPLENNNEESSESEKDVENKGTAVEDTPPASASKKAMTLGYIKGKVPPLVSRNVLRSESLKSVKELNTQKSSAATLPGVKMKGSHNGVYGPTPFYGHKDKVESPPPDSEEEEEVDSDLEVDTEAQNWQQTIIDKKILKKLKNKEVKRQEVIHELIHTERTHVRNLKVLNKIFYRPLLQKNILQEHQVKLIFPNLEELIEIHESLLIPLKKRSLDNEVIENIGDLMLERFDGEAGEKVKEACAKFCRGQKYALEQMKKLILTKKEFQAFMTVQESHPLCRRLKFTDIIASTHQRLVKYPLLLEGINKATPPPHQDYKNVEKCTKCCKQILNYVNSEIKEAENKLKLEEISKKVEDKRDTTDGDKFDITAHRMLLEGSLVWKINPSKRIDLHVVLLTDFLVLLQRQDERFILKTHSTTLGTADAKGHSPIIKITNIIIREVATDKKAFFLVSTSMTGPHIYELIAQSNMEKKSWVEHILDAQEMVKGRDVNSDRGRRGGLSISAMNQQPYVPTHRQENIINTSVIAEEGEKPDTEEKIPSTPASPTLSEDRNIPSKERISEILEELSTKDEQLKKILEEKNKMLCELQGIKEEELATLKPDEISMEPRDLVLAAIGQADRLTAAVNEVVTLTKDDLPTSDRTVIGESTTALHELLTKLLNTIQTRENEMQSLQDSYESAKATLSRLQLSKDDETYVSDEPPNIFVERDISAGDHEPVLVATATTLVETVENEEDEENDEEAKDSVDAHLRSHAEGSTQNTLLAIDMGTSVLDYVEI